MIAGKEGDRKNGDRKIPRTIGLFWDISSSGDQRDRQKEMELLKDYLRSFNDVTVSLVPFDIYTEPKEDFTISGGNADKLAERIGHLEYDGGTQFGAIDLSTPSVERMGLSLECLRVICNRLTHVHGGNDLHQCT